MVHKILCSALMFCVFFFLSNHYSPEKNVPLFVLVALLSLGILHFVIFGENRKAA